MHGCVFIYLCVFFSIQDSPLNIHMKMHTALYIHSLTLSINQSTNHSTHSLICTCSCSRANEAPQSGGLIMRLNVVAGGRRAGTRHFQVQNSISPSGARKCSQPDPHTSVRVSGDIYTRIYIHTHIYTHTCVCGTLGACNGAAVAIFLTSSLAVHEEIRRLARTLHVPPVKS